MSTIHIFAIGGTGSRVLRSLTMLLASGVDCKMDIHPIIVDPDFSNEDVTRTSMLIDNYSKLRKELSFNNSTKNKFFATNIDTTGGTRMPIENTSNKRFRDYMVLHSMPTDSQALLQGLFSDSDLDAEMQVGFEGHPNRGSVVLNQIRYSQALKEFANQFKQGDRVFIISSIFGGTGAAGFPLLFKILRDPSIDIPNHDLINKATIGAVTVLPYFKVKPDSGSPIDSATFISKARSALQYYKRNISDIQDTSKQLNYLYYIGDQTSKSYENHKGGKDQCNDAHFVELASALAIINFASQDDNGNGCFEYGIKNNTKEILFTDLGDGTQNLIRRPMTQMMLFYLLFSKHKDEMQKQKYVQNLSDGFLDTSWVRTFHEWLTNYHEWLQELDGNEVAFSPFRLDGDRSSSDPLDCVKGVKYNRPKLTIYKGFSHFDDMISEQRSEAADDTQRFVDILFSATAKMAQKDYIG